MKAPAFLIILAFLILAGRGSARGQETGEITYKERWLARDKVSHGKTCADFATAGCRSLSDIGG